MGAFLVVLSVLLLAVPGLAQDAGRERLVLATSRVPVTLLVRPPAAEVTALPVVALFGDRRSEGEGGGDHAAAAALAAAGTDLAAKGFGVAVVEPAAIPGDVDARVFAEELSKALRIRLPVARNRIQLVGFGDTGRAWAWRVAEAVPHEILALHEFVRDDERIPARQDLPFAHDPRRLGSVDRLDAMLEAMLGMPDDAARAAVMRALDDFHDAATSADAERYFGRFAPEGVFLGTDRTERWNVAQFRAWAGFAFERESAWMFTPTKQFFELAPGGLVAWFDEELHSRAYGWCRGSGVMRRIDGVWKVAQYNLTVPVPNDLMQDVVARIRAFEAGQAAARGDGGKADEDDADRDGKDG